MFKTLFKNKDARQHDATYEALIAAFCLVSYADGHLHVAELTRFIRLQARENPGLIPDEEQLIHDVVAYGKSFAKDYAKAKAQALKTIAHVATNSVLAQQIVKVAQIAAISDNHISPAEESIAAEIGQVLGITEV